MPTDHQPREQDAAETEVQGGMVITGLVVILMLALVVWTIVHS